MSDYINLHVHSNFSDGVFSPEEIINISKSKSIKYLSLTDHDTVNGYNSISINNIKDIKFIKGIEISTKNHDNLHILGYNIDIKNKSFLLNIKDYRERRIRRVKEIIKRLNDINISISFDELDFGLLTTIGRPHISDLLVKKGYGKTRTEVFHKYLVEGCYAYVKPQGPDIDEAIKTIKNAGGVCVLAHPSTIEGSFNLEDIIKKGFDGIEVFYPTHTNSKIRKYLEIARKYDLIVTAGTDYHGPGTDREKIDLYEYDFEKYFNIERLFQ